jgi:hypothetical protein
LGVDIADGVSWVAGGIITVTPGITTEFHVVLLPAALATVRKTVYVPPLE